MKNRRGFLKYSGMVGMILLSGCSESGNNQPSPTQPVRTFYQGLIEGDFEKVDTVTTDIMETNVDQNFVKKVSRRAPNADIASISVVEQSETEATVEGTVSYEYNSERISDLTPYFLTYENGQWLIEDSEELPFGDVIGSQQDHRSSTISSLTNRYHYTMGDSD